jgi:hypothetical protein
MRQQATYDYDNIFTDAESSKWPIAFDNIGEEPTDV